MVGVQINEQWTTLADEATVEKTVAALESNGFDVFVVENGAEAKQQVIKLVPAGAEVFTAASATLAATGIAEEINESGHYDSVRKKIMGLDRATHGREMRQLGATPAYVLGSAQAITEQGYAMFASFGGSQLTSYVQGAEKVCTPTGKRTASKDDRQGKQSQQNPDRARRSVDGPCHGDSGQGAARLLISPDASQTVAQDRR